MKGTLKGGFVWQTQHNAYHIRGFCRNPKGVPSAKLRRVAPRANLRRFFLPLLCTTKKPPLKGGFVWQTQHNAYHIRGFCRNPKGVPSAKLRRVAPRANLRRFFLPLLCATKKPPLKLILARTFKRFYNALRINRESVFLTMFEFYSGTFKNHAFCRSETWLRRIHHSSDLICVSYNLRRSFKSGGLLLIKQQSPILIHTV